MNTLKVFLLLSMVVGNVFCDGQIHSGYWDEESVAELVKSGGDLNRRNTKGEPPLLFMMREGNEELVKKLIKAGARVDVIDSDGNAALHLARSAELTKFLLDNGADPNAINYSGDTPLNVYCRENIDLEAMSRLVAFGADVNSQNDSMDCPLHSLLKELATLETTLGDFYDNCDCDYCDCDDCNCDDCDGCECYRVNFLKKLLTNSAMDVDVEDEDERFLLEKLPMLKKIDSGDCDYVGIIKLLINAGANVNARTESGESPLHLVAESMCSNHGTDIVRILLDSGADVNSEDYCSGNTPLINACMDGESLEVIKLLIERGADVSITNVYGNTPLHETGRVEVAEVLLSAGADINAQNLDSSIGYGRTPLHYAVLYRGKVDFVRWLLEHGAKINAVDGKKRTPLHEAASSLSGSNRLDVIRLLLERGAKINARDEGLRTTLHDAVSSWYLHDKDRLLDAIKLLVEFGADVTAKCCALGWRKDGTWGYKEDSQLTVLEAFRDKHLCSTETVHKDVIKFLENAEASLRNRSCS